MLVVVVVVVVVVVSSSTSSICLQCICTDHMRSVRAGSDATMTVIYYVPAD